MKSEELRSLQAPSKEKYSELPEVAIFTLKAEGRIGEGIHSPQINITRVTLPLSR